MQTETFRVTGMKRSTCAIHVEYALKTSPGVLTVDVAPRNGVVSVRYDEFRTSPDKLRAIVKHAGYDIAGDRTETGGSTGGCCG